MFYFITNAIDVDPIHNTEARHSIALKAVIIHLLSQSFLCVSLVHVSVCS